VAETNGAVRAVVGGKDYGESQFNRATRALRQPGSSFKVYVYMAALVEGVLAAVGRGGWSGVDRPVVAAQLCGRLSRPHADDHGADAVGEYGAR
jgi:membrane peptidoglycan carboxypeptidase